MATERPVIRAATRFTGWRIVAAMLFIVLGLFASDDRHHTADVCAGGAQTHQARNHLTVPAGAAIQLDPPNVAQHDVTADWTQPFSFCLR